MKCFLILLLIWSPMALAKDLGKFSQTFPILEEGMISMIKRRLCNIDVAAKQKDFESKVRQSVLNPKSLKIKRTERARTFMFDPTYIVKEDIILPDGQMLHKAGTKVNPLDHFDLDQKLIFIDGSDKESIPWIKANQYQQEKIILVGGSPLELQKELKIEEVYFDQFGALTEKFGIQQVPALVQQQGKQLKIMELKYE